MLTSGVSSELEQPPSSSTRAAASPVWKRFIADASLVQQVAQAQAQPLLTGRAVLVAHLKRGDGDLGRVDQRLVLGLGGGGGARRVDGGAHAVGGRCLRAVDLELDRVEIEAAHAREGPL